MLKYLLELGLMALLEFSYLCSLSPPLLFIKFLVLVKGVLALHGFEDDFLKSLPQVKDSVLILNELHEILNLVPWWVSCNLLTYLALQVLDNDINI